ncbi:anhydro-N-acetylmuramic acid kinase [Hellea balneolensis]|uniref:anhydro-N-acetylmuramic acid kinase n=1 Tax=Hellea balneolensis TaxID=287478 RepID=UPI0003FE0668|nr:anhydro-N-acetylmuramic acid kinase [Hellea balneolensis]
MGHPHYIALGLMSGTSLDGVDAAFLETDGERIIRLGPSLCFEYSQEDKLILEAATQAALRWQFEGPRPNNFVAAETVILKSHIRAVNALCEDHREWAAELKLIGFHGQTVLHHPPKALFKGRTLQLGDGKALAKAVGKPVWYDFRTADMAARGQGAPLAPVYHQALVAYSKLDRPTAVLNIGGVGNVTLITKDGHIIASDTGPGNGPLDNWMSRNGMGAFDPDGKYAAAGEPHFPLVRKWLEREFFQQPTPRSADRYDFDVINDMDDLTIENGAATLAAFTTLAAVYTLNGMREKPRSLIVCGGGRHNKGMMWMLREHLDATVKTAEEVGWNSDAIEAQAFAYLAVRAKWKLPISFPTTTGVAKPMTGGVLAMP